MRGLWDSGIAGVVLIAGIHWIRLEETAAFLSQMLIVPAMMRS